MTLELAILIAQSLFVTHQAAWLTLGVLDNIKHPKLNGQFTAEVMELERMKQMYPDSYETMKRRVVSNPAIQNAMFRFVVAFETVTVLLMWSGAIMMIASIFGVVDLELAHAIAIIGCAAFTSIWAGFLVIGNHFAYWFCHEGAQNTHFQMTIWGVGTTMFLTM